MLFVSMAVMSFLYKKKKGASVKNVLHIYICVSIHIHTDMDTPATQV